MTLFHVALSVERWRVMFASAIPLVPALSVLLMMKLWLIEAVGGATAVRFVAVGFVAVGFELQ